MPIVVDKQQKRKDIALSCKDIFFQHGINDLTISQIAKTAGVGKGTIYEYFKNKEEIIFEIVGILIKERNILVKSLIEKESTTKDKIKQFSRFFYSDEDVEMRQLYKEFISISLINPDEEMMAFNKICTNGYFDWFQSIIKDGVLNGELQENALKLVNGMYAVSEGIFIKATVTGNTKNIEKEILEFHDAIFELIEVKK